MNIILSDFFENLQLYKQIIYNYQNRREIFYDYINQISFKGSFPYSIWDYENFNFNCTSNETIRREINYMQDNNVCLFLNCRNTKLENNHFHDNYSNMILEYAKEISCFTIVNSDNLAQYIKNNYPQISIIADKNMEILINKELYSYKIIDKNAVKEITDNKNKYILYLNKYCPDKCSCIEEKSKDKLNYCKIKSFECRNYIKLFKDSMQSNNFIDNEDIEKYIDSGFSHFIISTNKEDKYENLECILYFLIKPAYIDKFRLNLLKEVPAILCNKNI